MVRIATTVIGILVIVAFLGAAGAIFVFHHFGRDLPDYTQLADYQPPVMTRVHAGDGQLLAEYAIEKRVFVPVKAMPRRVVQAFLSAEDKNFYYHPGIDVIGVFRAALTNVKNIGQQRRPVGASTITQQVAKNFLLSNEVSWTARSRKRSWRFASNAPFPRTGSWNSTSTRSTWASVPTAWRRRR